MDRREELAAKIKGLNGFGPEKQAVFLEILAEKGNVSAAAKFVGISRTEAYRTYQRDETFAALWDEALEIACDILEAEAHRRAVEGVDEPVFYRGEEIGAIKKYSDTLLLRLLEAHRPSKWRSGTKHEFPDGPPATQTVVLNWGDNPLPDTEEEPDVEG
jgi:hypothetical protein